jgi:hypothetical protein
MALLKATHYFDHGLSDLLLAAFFRPQDKVTNDTLPGVQEYANTEYWVSYVC